MDIIEYTRKIREERMRLLGEVNGIYDEAIKGETARELSAEERQKVDRMDARIAEIETEVSTLDEKERREKEAATARDAFNRQYGHTTPEDRGSARGQDDEFRAWARGERRGFSGKDGDGEVTRNGFTVNLRAAARERDLIRQGYQGEELRALLWDTGSAGSLVPTTLSRTLYGYLEAGIAAYKMPTTKINTASGEALQFPKVAAHAIATQVSGQGTALAGTDPSFGRMQLDSFKYGELVQIASEVVTDSGIDIIEFVGRDVGRAVARKTDTDLIVGTGSGQPQGMMSAVIVGSAGTIATGGTLVTPTYENLVDTVYSVNDQYRMSSACAWLMRDATAGQLRKLRDGAGGTVGAVLWRPSLTQGIQGGQPDLLVDYPVYTDPNVASLASNARIIAFGDFSAYYLRQVGDFVFERSDDYAFNVDEITFRGKWRVDGDYIDLTAVNLLKQSV